VNEAGFYGSAPIAVTIIATTPSPTIDPVFAVGIIIPLLSAETGALTGLAFAPSIFLPVENGFSAPLRWLTLD
jgi:hypothetical protein